VVGVFRGSGGAAAARSPRTLYRYGYLHIAVFGSIVATGAGLHAAADFIEHRSGLDSVATVVAVAVPVGVYIGAVYGTYLLLSRAWDGFYAAVVLVTLSVLGTAVALASVGVSPRCVCWWSPQRRQRSSPVTSGSGISGRRRRWPGARNPAAVDCDADASGPELTLK
jgi:predicted transporter